MNLTKICEILYLRNKINFEIRYPHIFFLQLILHFRSVTRIKYSVQIPRFFWFEYGKIETRKTLKETDMVLSNQIPILSTQAFILKRFSPATMHYFLVIFFTTFLSKDQISSKILCCKVRFTLL